MGDYTPAAFTLEGDEARPTGPRLRDIKEGGYTVITGVSDRKKIILAQAGGSRAEHTAYPGGSGMEGAHTLYREDIAFQFKSDTQLLPEPSVLTSMNGVSLPPHIIAQIRARRLSKDVSGPITKEELIDALNDPRSIKFIGQPYFTEFRHISEGLSQVEAQKGATIGLQMNGRNEVVLGPKRVAPGDILEGKFLSLEDLKPANIETNRSSTRSSIRGVPHDPTRPQKMAQQAICDVVCNTSQTHKAMNLDPWSVDADRAGYKADDENFVGATLAKGSLTHLVLGIYYLMNKKILSVSFYPDVVGGELPDNVDNDHPMETAVFLAQLLGAVPVESSSSDYMMKKVPADLTTTLFRETVLSMSMPETVKLYPLLFGANANGTENSLLNPTTHRLRETTSIAAKLFKSQQSGFNQMIAAFTQLLNGQLEHQLGVALRGEPGNAICSYLKR